MNYTCEVCGGTYETEKTNEQAMMEYHAALQKQQLPDDGNHAIICDDCFKQFNSWYESLSLDQINEMRAEERLEPLTKHPGGYFENIN